MGLHYRKSNNVISSHRESHCHPSEDCCHIHTATWQHQLQLLQLSPLVLRPRRSPTTTISEAHDLGCDSTLIRSPPLSPHAKACSQPGQMLQTHGLSCPNLAAGSQAQCMTITATKPRPRRRLFHIKPLSKVPMQNIYNPYIYI